MNKVDCLIPLMHNGSKHNNLELRYCLRSIEKHLSGYGNIYVVGELPGWINKETIIHIPFEDSTDNKQWAWNIYQKILVGCSYLDDWKIYQTTEDFKNKKMTFDCICLSNNFLYINDDHYLLTDYVAGEFPYYHRGRFEYSEIKKLARSQQMQIGNTACEWPNNTEVFDFDVHCPVLFNKIIFRNLLPEKDWPDYGYCIKSFYCNNVIDTTNWVPCEDLKFSERIMMKESIYKTLEGRSWFSIGDRALLEGSKMKEVLNELYPNKSKYEND